MVFWFDNKKYSSAALNITLEKKCVLNYSFDKNVKNQ